MGHADRAAGAAVLCIAAEDLDKGKDQVTADFLDQEKQLKTAGGNWFKQLQLGE